MQLSPSGVSELCERLRARRCEIEQAVLTRVSAIADPDGAADPAYAEGLQVAVFAALDFGLTGLERGEEHAPPIPTAMLSQARLAARNGIPLDTVLRRYLAGYTLLGDFILIEAERVGLVAAKSRLLLRSQAILLDRLLTSVSEEYAREEHRSDTPERRRADRVERLLAGELLDTSELRYDFDATHLGILIVGVGASEAIRECASVLGCRSLLIPREENRLWAWLGARRPLDPAEIGIRFSSRGSTDFFVAVGESARGLAGWRLTHRQAAAALPVALRGQERIVRYSDVALLASILRDDLLGASLHRLYLAPLEKDRDGGHIARGTLRAYLAAQRNVSSAAAALRVSRHTVANRLRAVEEKLGCSLDSRLSEIEAALRLFDLTDRTPEQRQE